MKILYISYDGILEPLGQSQVLSYITRFNKKYQIILISFEKNSDWKDSKKKYQIYKIINDNDIKWYALRYHKWPSVFATSWDIICGLFLAIYIIYFYKVRIVHARSYVPSLIAFILKKITSIKFIFDMRGFWPDERIDGEIWKKNSFLYKISKYYEIKFLTSSDYVVSLTNAAVNHLINFPQIKSNNLNIEVITTCTDLNIYKPLMKKIDYDGNNPFILGYVGSAGVWYKFDETLECFKYLKLKIPNSILYILNRGEHDYIVDRIKFHGIDMKSIRLESADRDGVVKAMQEMHAGIFFIKQTFSKIASAPTKLGEFLACGIPCLSNSQIGDMSSIIEGEKVGVAIRNFDEVSMLNAIQCIINLTREKDIIDRCRMAATTHFSIDNGIKKYEKIYSTLINCK